MEASNVVQGQELDNSPKYLMVKSDQLEGRVSKVEETMQGMVKEIQQMKAAFHRFAKMVSCYMCTSHCWPLFLPAVKKSHTYLILESSTNIRHIIISQPKIIIHLCRTTILDDGIFKDMIYYDNFFDAWSHICPCDLIGK